MPVLFQVQTGSAWQTLHTLDFATPAATDAVLRSNVPARLFDTASARAVVSSTSPRFRKAERLFQ